MISFTFLSTSILLDLLSCSNWNIIQSWLDESDNYDASFEIAAICYEFDLGSFNRSSDIGDILPRHLQDLLIVSNVIRRLELINWLVFLENPNLSWLPGTNDCNYRECIRNYLDLVGFNNDYTGCIKVANGSIFEIASMLYLFSWKMSYANVVFYNLDNNLMLQWNHHGVLFVISTQKEIVCKLNDNLLSNGLHFKTICA